MPKIKYLGHHCGRRIDSPLLQLASQRSGCLGLSGRRCGLVAGSSGSDCTETKGSAGSCRGRSACGVEFCEGSGHHQPALRELPLGSADSAWFCHRTGRHHFAVAETDSPECGENLSAGSAVESDADRESDQDHRRRARHHWRLV